MVKPVRKVVIPAAGPPYNSCRSQSLQLCVTMAFIRGYSSPY